MNQLYSLLMLVKFLMLFLLLYIIIPSRLITFTEESSEFTDKFFISLVHSSLITIICVHFLVGIKLYETFSLIAIFLFVYFIVAFIKGGGSPAAMADALGMKTVVNVLDFSEQGMGVTEEFIHRVMGWIKSALRRLKLTLINSFRNPFQGILTFCLLLGAAYIRFKHSLEHLYYGASDSYVILAWTKYLEANLIYRDGIYPYGHEALISPFHKLFFMDPYMVVRFIGPLAGFLMVFSAYYFVKKNYQSVQMTLLVVFLLGIVVDHNIIPNYVWRQISALPQEYSSIFLLPGVSFFLMYYKYQKINYLILAGECVALTILIHPYVTVFLVLSYVVIFFYHSRISFKLYNFVRITMVMLASLIIGLLPMVTAFLAGMEFHGSLGYVQKNLQTTETEAKISILQNILRLESEFKLLIVFSLIIIIYYTLKQKLSKNGEDIALYGTSIIIGTIGILFLFLYTSSIFGLPQIMESNRIGIYLSMFMAVIFSLGIKVIDLFHLSPWKKNIGKTLVCLTIILSILNFSHFEIPVGNALEYDEAVQAYLDIKKEFEPLNWTIISPVQQYQQVLGFGWHYDLLGFTQQISNNETKLTFPTDYIFIFVEKYPLGSTSMITSEDAAKPIPPIPSQVDSMYQDVESRRILEAKLYIWVEDYMKTHTNMQVYSEGKFLKVYMIKQEGTNPANLFDRGAL